MASKTKLTSNICTGPNKIKLLTLHPQKQWVAFVAFSNTFSLWNYAEKILIKCFNCSTLDESANVDIKQLIFYDKYSLAYQSKCSSMKSNIIFASNSKIFFYDYITDVIKQINQKQIQNKSIKKICPYSQTKICVGLNDGSIKIIDNKDLYVKNTMSIRTIKGYHTKSISWIFPYCQNINQTPRVISISGVDGLMACWNIQTILMGNSESATPSFKFQKGNKSSHNQQIISVQYDAGSYKLVTLTQNFISLWSTMTGIQIKRIKNVNRFKQILFFNHFSYGSNCFIAFNQGKVLYIINQNATTKKQLSQAIFLDNYIDKTDNIVFIKNLSSNPSELFILTNTNLLTVQIDRFYRPIFGFHNSFVTKLTTINSKQFIIKGQGSIKTQINLQQIQKIKCQEDILFNTFYLSADSEWVYFNLIEIQIQSALNQHRKYKLGKIQTSSIFSLGEGSQSFIDVSYDGKSFFIFNKVLSYFQIWSLDQLNLKRQNLMELNQISSKIDFYSKFYISAKGMCRDIVWHQYKDKFAAFCPFDKNDILIVYESTKQKKGIFQNLKSQKPSDKLSGQIVKWCLCIFQKKKNSSSYAIVVKSQAIKSKICRVFSVGSLFGYSSQKQGYQTIQYINEEKNQLRQIENQALFPERIYTSYCESYQIFVYDSYFTILKVQQNGSLTYHQTIHEKVCEGLFWDKFFFFATKTQIFFLQMTTQDKVLIKLADSIPPLTFQAQKNLFPDFYYDDFQETVNYRPEGQLQFLAIVNFHLLMVNQNENIVLFSLKKFVYIQFCLQTACGNTERVFEIYDKSCQELKTKMKETLNAYGIILPYKKQQQKNQYQFKNMDKNNMIGY